MRLNPDCVRNILLYIEENLDYKDSQSETPSQHKEISFTKLPSMECFKKFDKQELSYAIELLIKEKFLECSKCLIKDGEIYIADIIGLSWKGNELLNQVRNNTAWNAVKERGKKIGVSSIEILSNITSTLAMAMMQDPNAIHNFIEGTQNLTNIFPR